MVVHIVFITLLFIIYYITGGVKSEQSQVTRKRQVTYMGILMFLFAALRSPVVGSDLLGYDKVEAGYWLDYLQDALMSFGEVLVNRAGRDPVFHCFLKLLSYVSDSPQLMLVVIGGIFAFGFSYFVYHTKGNVLLSYMMLIGFRIFSFSLSGLRQTIAMGLIFIAYICLRDKRYVWYVILTLIASAFHTSALVFFVSFPLIFVRSRIVFGGLLLLLLLNFSSGGLIVNYLASVFYSGRFHNYLARSVGMEFEGGATFFIYIIFYFLILLSYPSIRIKDSTFSKEFNIMSMGIFFSTIGQSMDNVFRIAYYFVFLLFPATSQMIAALVNNKRAYSFICSVLSIMLAIQYIPLGTGAGTDHYEFFWNYRY